MGDMLDRSSLHDMVRIPEGLGAEIDFVRADLYLLGDRIVFGELTQCLAGGTGRFDQAEYDELIGSWREVPKRYE